MCVCVHSSVCMCVCVRARTFSCTQFIGCEMTLETIATLTLTKLPQWQRKLSFINCTWPERPAAYRLLAYTIPTSFTHWELSGGHSRDVAESLCLGAAEHRGRYGASKHSLSVHSGTVGTKESVPEYSNGVKLLPPLPLNVHGVFK